MATFDKAASAVLDYVVDWSTWLDSDTISTSSWSADTGLTVASSANSTTTATAWLSGGTLGAEYNVTNTIVTVGGRTDARSFTVKIRARYE